MYIKHHTTSFISFLLHRIRLLHLFPVSFASPILGGTGVGPCWVSSVWLPFSVDCPLEDFCLLHLAVRLSLFVFIVTAVPWVARVIFCPLWYCPVCHTKATWNQMLPLIGVHRSWFLTLHHRCVCSPSARQYTHWTRGFFSRFIPLDPPCSVKMVNRAASCRMWLFITHGRSWAQSGWIFRSHAHRMGEGNSPIPVP
jgi:hypothetical protein